jgi:demethylmenaquinone methyltransferase / 2-methoxy-6-polyprenyl-1,4-benzoquinol methylase
MSVPTARVSRRMTPRTAEAGRAEGFARDLFDGLADRYDRLGWVLSFGQDRRWRRTMVDAVCPLQPASVLDVATGPGGVAIEVAERTGARVVGVDVTAEMLRRAATNTRRCGRAGQVRLVEARAEHLPFADASFDALTFTYLLRYVADPASTLAELSRVVRPGGVVASLEFHVPSSPVWYPLWWLYTRAVLPLAGYAMGGREWWDVGRFLGPSISGHYARYPMAVHVRAWQDAGITDVRTRIMSLGGGVVMWGRKS